MADNTTLPGNATVVATDEIGGVHHQRVKVGWGADGAFDDVSLVKPLPVRQQNADGTLFVGVQPYGMLRTSPEPTTLFYDPFDAALDTANRWATSGSTAPSTTNGLTSLSASGPGNTSVLTSLPTFNAFVPGFLQSSWLTKFDASGAAVTAGYRFMGIGTSPASPTQAAPLTNAYGFAIDTDGKMYFDVWAGGTRISRTDMSSTGTGTAQNKQPLDGGWHRYITQYRTDRIYVFLDTLDAPIITLVTQTPNVQTLPLKAMLINGTPQNTALTFQVQGVAVADTGRNAISLTDGVHPWRRLTIKPAATPVDIPFAVQDKAMSYQVETTQ